MLRLLGYFFQFLLLILLARIIWNYLRRLMARFQVAFHSESSRNARQTTRTSGQTFRDPFCGTFVSSELSVKLKEGNQVHHFCSQECLKRFQALPGR